MTFQSTDMPQGNNIEQEEGPGVNIHVDAGRVHQGGPGEGQEDGDQGPGIWVRARLQKNGHGHWVRVGRLTRVHYRD